MSFSRLGRRVETATYLPGVDDRYAADRHEEMLGRISPLLSLRTVGRASGADDVVADDVVEVGLEVGEPRLLLYRCELAGIPTGSPR
jgi:hypothetical protein